MGSKEITELWEVSLAVCCCSRPTGHRDRGQAWPEVLVGGALAILIG